MVLIYRITNSICPREVKTFKIVVYQNWRLIVNIQELYQSAPKTKSNWDLVSDLAQKKYTLLLSALRIMLQSPVEGTEM